MAKTIKETPKKEVKKEVKTAKKVNKTEKITQKTKKNEQKIEKIEISQKNEELVAPAKTSKNYPKKRKSPRTEMYKILEMSAKDYAKKMGRPTKYEAKFPSMMLAYFDLYVGINHTASEDSSLCVDVNLLTGQRELRAYKFPTFERFASIIGVSYEVLIKWRNEKDPEDDSKNMYPDFMQTYELCKTIQNSILIEGGITGALRGGFLNLAAKNILNWQDKVEQEHSYTGTEEMFKLLAESSASLFQQTASYTSELTKRQQEIEEVKRKYEQGDA